MGKSLHSHSTECNVLMERLCFDSANSESLRVESCFFLNSRFVNYFGSQRLGQQNESLSVPAQIGRYLLQKQWKKALLLFLDPGVVFTVRNHVIWHVG